MLTCKHWDKFLDDYLAGRLGRVRSFIFWLHMKLCPPCERYLNEYRRAIEAAHRHASDPVVAPLEPELADQMAKCLSEKQRK